MTQRGPEDPDDVGEDDEFDDADDEWADDDFDDDLLDARLALRSCAEGHVLRWRRAWINLETGPDEDGDEGAMRRLWVRDNDCNAGATYLETHLIMRSPKRAPYLVIVSRRALIFLDEWADVVELEDAHEWREEVRLDG